MIVLLLVLLVIIFTLIGTLVYGKDSPSGTFVINSQTSTNNIIYSDDGETWTASVDENGNNPFGDTGSALDVHWNRGTWVAVGEPESVNENTIAWSDDAKIWNYGTGQSFETNGRFVRYGNGLWVSGGTPGAAGNSVLKYSNDGKSWSDSTGEAFGNGATGTCSAISFYKGFWLAGGNDGSNGTKIWYSTDGISWSAATGSPFGTSTNSNPLGFIYGNGRWVAIGNDADGSGSVIWYSDNGIAWSESTHPFTTSGNTIWDVAYYGGLYVVGGIFHTGGTILAYSTDGIVFTAATGLGSLSNGYVIDNIALPLNGYWLANGTDGTTGLVYRSVDGKNWTNVTPDTFFPGPGGLVRGNATKKGTRTVVTGSSSSVNSNIYWTDDGENWNQVSNTLNGSNSLEITWAPV